MFRLLLIIAVLLDFATMSRAGTPNCLPEPTQACVFQMALAHAEETSSPAQLFMAYMRVA